MLSVGLAGTLFIFLLWLPDACINATRQATIKGDDCIPSSCGNIPNISYPFRLKGQPSGCGIPELELDCENNRTTFTPNEFYYNHLKFYVKEISYLNKTIRLVDSSLERDKCSIPRSSFFMASCISSYLNDGYHQFIYYLTCKEQIKSSLYVDASPCTNATSSPRNFFYVTDIRTLLSDFKESCRVEAQVVYNWIHNITGLSIFEIYEQLLEGTQFQFFCENTYIKPKKSLFSRILWRLQYILQKYGEGFEVFFFHESHSTYDGYTSGTQHAAMIITVVLFSIRTILGILCLAACVMYKLRRRHLSTDDIIEDFLQKQNNFMPIRYSYSEIKRMSRGFKDELGKGGFGSVFKGKLRSGHFVAVKLLNKSKANGQDFINEVATIGRIHHVNVMRLIGFCVEGSKRALVYDFMPNGSLDKIIFSKEKDAISLSWQKMFEIALGVARGMDYLHRGCHMQILHFDIKPHNILLDDNFNPKVSDFGLAKLCPIEDSIVSLTAVRGTQGYMAPELFYKNIGGVSYKADVYSFGMLLMEMIGRRKALKASVEQISQIYFPSWIYDQLDGGEDIELGNIEIEEDEMKLVKKMVIVALWCIQMNPDYRPSMNKVLEMLESEAEVLEMPPKPDLLPQEMSTQKNPSASNHVDGDVPKTLLGIPSESTSNEID